MSFLRQNMVIRALGLVVLNACCWLAAAQGPSAFPERFPAEISFDSQSALRAFVGRESGGLVIVDSVRGTWARVFLSEADFQRLAAGGHAISRVAQTPPGDAKHFVGYHDYEEVTAELAQYADDFPDICRLSSLGATPQGRELWVLLITDNPDVEEDEPEFKYVSTMHGNEPVGTELCLYFIDLLLSGYGTDTRLTALVDETAISIVPLMNPDGHAVDRRSNSLGADLNRSFPVFPTDFIGTYFDGEDPDLDNRQPEVRHVMNWTLDNSFVLSANFHTGALLVNYPYDDDADGDTRDSGEDAPTPDDLLFEDISLRYAIANTPMFNSTVFENGISNGLAWFIAIGSMQDWNYRYAGCMEVTIELSDIFRPGGSFLPTFWEDNRESMLAYLEAVHIGGQRYGRGQRTAGVYRSGRGRLPAAFASWQPHLDN